MKVVIIGKTHQNILQSKKMENLIDSFDKIIRLGQFVISGYEETCRKHATDVCITRWGKYTKITPTERQHISDIWFSSSYTTKTKYSDRYYSGAEHACNLAEYNITNERYIDIEDMCTELKSPDLTLGTASILMAQKYLSEYDIYITGYCLDMTNDRLNGKYWDMQITQWNDNHNLLTETMYIRRFNK